MPDIVKLPAHELSPLRLTIPRPQAVEIRTTATPIPSSKPQPQKPGISEDELTARETELDQIREDARRRGYDQGIADAERQLAERSRAMAALMSNMARQLDQHVEDIERVACSLAMACMTRLFGEAMSTEAGALACIRQVLAEHAQLVDAELHIHPNDAQAVRAMLDRSGKMIHRRLRIVADTRITRGGCMLRSQRGDLDAGAETLWRDIAAVLETGRYGL